MPIHEKSALHESTGTGHEAVGFIQLDGDMKQIFKYLGVLLAVF